MIPISSKYVYIYIIIYIYIQTWNLVVNRMINYDELLQISGTSNCTHNFWSMASSPFLKIVVIDQFGSCILFVIID